MKSEIIAYLADPKKLEELYQKDKVKFKKTFLTIYPNYKGQMLADFWNERLFFDRSEINWGGKTDLIIIILASLLAGLIAKIPSFFSINEDFFYPRNVGFIVFPILTSYFAWKNKLSAVKIILMAVATLVSLVFINLMPFAKESDTLILSCIHLILFLWAILGFGYTNGKGKERLNFLKYNGDLVVMTTLILISGGLLAGLTVGLFQLIGVDIEKYYFQNIVIFGVAAAPVIGTFLTRSNPQLVGIISPVIAKLFSPLVVVMLLVYIGSIIYFDKNPYNNREFLLIFNLLLIGVMALIFFSVAGNEGSTRNKFQIWVLLTLSVLTLIVNAIALSAIIFRISELGTTPNRLAVMGGNVLIAVNLVLVTIKLLKIVVNKDDLGSVGKIISNYLPVYVIWAIIVTFLFPFVFRLN